MRCLLPRRVHDKGRHKIAHRCAAPCELLYANIKTWHCCLRRATVCCGVVCWHMQGLCQCQLLLKLLSRLSTLTARDDNLVPRVCEHAQHVSTDDTVCHAAHAAQAFVSTAHSAHVRNFTTLFAPLLKQTVCGSRWCFLIARIRTTISLHASRN